MRNTRKASTIGFMLAGSLIAGVTGATVATAAPSYPMQVAAAATEQPVLMEWALAQQKPKKVTVRVRCDKVKNGTPAGGHSEEKIVGVGRAFDRKKAEKEAEKDVDRQMPPGYHKRHCHPIK
ncbi:hypothetical protein ACL02S_11395 [Nocardia sp. 004]|uniref:hypothetical protein n=1 Tax=Nocardia sp. 004 TaxID=3385978 RepID=UPI0039A24E27